MMSLIPQVLSLMFFFKDSKWTRFGIGKAIFYGKNQDNIASISSNTCVVGWNTLLADIGRELVCELSWDLQLRAFYQLSRPQKKLISIFA